MSLYDKMFNIQNHNIETEIRGAIDKTKEELKGLDYDRMCFIYTSYLKQNLQDHHVLAHIIDTKDDLDLSYQHRLLLVPSLDILNVYYLVDLTYCQFPKSEEYFPDLLEKGYMKVDDQSFQKYLTSVSSDAIFKSYNLDTVFHYEDSHHNKKI